MFEHFTFGAQPQPHSFEDSYPSPTDTSCLSLAPPTSYPFPTLPQNDLSEIVAKLQQQTLQQQSREELVKRFRAWKDISPGELEVDDEMDSSEPESETVSLPPTPISASVSCKRLQRQLNVQLQNRSTHIKDINALVENMIDSNSQCRITSRGYISPPPSASEEEDSPVTESTDLDERLELDDIDEGFCDGEVDDDDELEMSLRRASTPAGIRKWNARYGRSADVIIIGGRTKIKSLPRMRKRKVRGSK